MKPLLRERNARFLPIYLAAFLFSLHIALPLYVNSSFLGQFLPQGAIGFVYATSSAIAIFLLAKFPNALSRFGNYKIFLFISVAQTALFTTLALPLSPFVIIPVFIAAQILIILGFFSLDVFLERFSKNTTTGVTRGILLTVVNFAVLMGPVTTGVILTNGDFWKAYLVAAGCVAAAALVVGIRLKNFRDPEYHATPYTKMLLDIVLARHPNDEIRHAIIANFVLRFFYSWMVIYTPIYLTTYMKFAWGEVGIILGIMLLPFVLFEIPAGYLSDTKIGEKKIMITGFLIMSVFTASLFLVKEPTLWIWAALLFATRVGASFVEITSESYFFKHIESSDANILSVYRDAEPLAYVIAPIAASLLLVTTNMAYLFPVLSLVLLVGVSSAFRMKPILKEKTLVS